MSFALLCLGCPSRARPPDSGPAHPRALAHAHNDYEHARPLLDALDARFQSVEADIWYDVSDAGVPSLGVSHDGAPYKGTLQALYLDPLAARVQSNGGSVYGDGEGFYLWLDLKDGSQALQDELVSELSGYPFLTQFPDMGAPTAGAVTVILTGNSAKEALVQRPAPRPFIRDAEPYAATDPPADDRWGYYALYYWDHLAWDGSGTIPGTQQRILQKLVDDVHATGRKLRLYASPDTPGYWQAALDSGEDFINADDLTGLRAVLDANP